MSTESQADNTGSGNSGTDSDINLTSNQTTKEFLPSENLSVKSPESIAVDEILVVTGNELPVVSEKESSVVPESGPPAVAQKEPAAVLESESSDLAHMESAVVPESEPPALAQKESAVVPESEPPALAQKESAVVPESEPPALAQKESAVVPESEPPALAQKESAVVSESERLVELESEPPVLAKEGLSVVPEGKNSSVTLENDEQSESVFDSGILMQQEMVEGSDLSQNDNSVTKTYISDFLFPSGAGNMVFHSDPPVKEEKGDSLKMFPEIAKCVETTDYETLQELYQLLYLRNAWDTESILVQRILEFSGFNCEPNSEDYYTREVKLRTMPDAILEKIKNVLCLDKVKKIQNTAKYRLDLVTKIMTFLYKPKKKKTRRRSRQVGVKQPRSTSGTSKANTKQPLIIAIDSDKSTSKAGSCESGVQKNFKGNIRPGPLSSKSKEIDEETLLKIEKNLKKDIENGKAVELKVELNRNDISVFYRHILGSENSDTSSKESKEQKKETEKKDAKPENKSLEQVPEKPRKLKDFPEVLSSIEGTPEELLTDIHFLIFLKNSEVQNLKENILEFGGLTCEVDDEAYLKRKDFLEKKSEEFVENVSRALFLILKSNKEDNISHILNFLKKPQELYLKHPVITPGLLSDSDLDIGDLSDSDDSITCEVVSKKVECIDLLSSGEDNDTDVQCEPTNVEVKKEKVDSSYAGVPKSSADRSASKKRTLRNFETITKIVNTHPNEYLVDIYNLLYMSAHEPSSLRQKILDFSGFEFEKGSSEYIKRKQYLDRMLYNSVRRIYNTLIHNTREVKVFSKPTMIGEIFQFLFKLPDTDTSVIPHPTVPTNKVPSYQMQNKVVTVDVPISPGLILPNQSQKLSELKRVFQRVACFPCEYLVDVHKLLFMTDCDMKDIRSNIFGFKGFSFGVDSPEFNQRKMYLEYLTFHSLRKISSVLTTKTVDLRNSTKHELASHLTQVLAEYTNTYFETEPIESNEPAEPESSVNNPEPSDDSVEKIVITPIIEPLRPSPSNSPAPSPSIDTSKSVENVDVTVSSSTSVSEAAEQHSSKVQQPSPVQNTSPSRTKRTASSSQGRSRNTRRKSAKSSQKSPPPPTNVEQTQSGTSQSEIEKYNQMYNKPIYQGHSVGYNVPGIMTNVPPNYLIEQVPPNMVPQPYGHMVPQTIQFPVIHRFPQMQVAPQPAYTISAAALRPTINPNDRSHMPVESTYSEDKGSVHAPKKMKLETLLDKQDESMSSSSIHQIKIRDAVTKTSDDEEDGDKPLSMLVGHPNDKVLKQQICDIVEQTDLQDLTMNGVIQKIFSMYPQFNLNYRKEFIKSTLRSILYRLGEKNAAKSAVSKNNTSAPTSRSPDCSVSTTDMSEGTFQNSPPLEPIPEDTWKTFPSPAFQPPQNS